ncbi:MAG: hypothetical protein V7603_3350 [Micromonosporaceae bacterium]
MKLREPVHAILVIGAAVAVLPESATGQTLDVVR